MHIENAFLAGGDLNEVSLLKSIVAKQSYDIDALKRELVGQQARSIQNNILVHNIPEFRDETCAER